MFVSEQKSIKSFAHLGTILILGMIVANNALKTETVFDGISPGNVYRDDIYMQNTISDFLFHLNISEIMSRWSAHLGVWVMTQVAFCRDVLLQVVFCARQDQWRCAVWLNTENHTHKKKGENFVLITNVLQIVATFIGRGNNLLTISLDHRLGHILSLLTWLRDQFYLKIQHSIFLAV